MNKNQNYTIVADEVMMGKGVRIGDGVSISGGFDFDTGKLKPAKKVVLGDGVFLGHDIEIACPSIEIGDYTMIREGTKITGRKEASIGSCCWIGQDCILNTHGGLFIGNGVGIGAHSQLWTHIRFGDVLQGCRWEGDTPMTVEDDVWFVGHCLVSPIHAKKKSMAMLGSVITRDMEENHIYAGVPAKDMSDKLGFQYDEVSVEKKYEVMQEKLAEFYKQRPEYPQSIVIVKDSASINANNKSFFDVSNRTYTKRLTEEEMDFMKFLLVTIKFYPL
jgi:acetyltransferase-like isoleucine patch superfamily enzyme